MSLHRPKKPKNPNQLRLLADSCSQREAVPALQLAAWDLAKLAGDVIALNRQAGSSPASTMPERHRCAVAPLESLQCGVKIISEEAEATVEGAEVQYLKPISKES